MLRRAIASALLTTMSFTSVMCTTHRTTPLAQPKLAHTEIHEFVKGFKPPGANADGDSEGIASGTDTGALNLALLSDPKVLQYVKDYFKICKDAEDGKIFDFKYQLPCHAYFGMNLAEQGTYSGTLIPKSYIPKAKVLSGYTGNATLFNYNGSVCGSVGVEPGCDKDGYYTCFQLDDTNAHGKVGAYKAPYTGGAGKNTTAPRACDHHYFPDQLHQVVARLNNSMSRKDKFKTGAVKKDYLPLIGDLAHARGEGAVEPFVGVPLKGYGNDAKGMFDIYCKSSKQDYDEFLKQVNLYGDYFFAKPINVKCLKGIEFDAPMQRMLSCIYFMNVGWKMKTGTGSEIFRTFSRKGAYGDEKICGIFEAVTGQKKSRSEIEAWVKSNMINDISSKYNKADYGLNVTDYFPPGLKAMRRNGIMIKEENYTSSIYKAGTKPVLRYSDNLNLGHALTTITISKFMYGALLQYFKLPVDPTNPSTYLVGGSSGAGATPTPAPQVDGVKTPPQNKPTDYMPTNNIVKPTCAIRNVVPSRGKAKLIQNGLCAYFGTGSKANSNTALADTPNYSVVNSVGEKDGMPVFTQGNYYTNGVKDYGGYKMPSQGCPIFALCSLMYGVGMGTDKGNHLTPQLKSLLATADCPKVNGTSYLSPMALAKGISWLNSHGSPWAYYDVMLKQKLGLNFTSIKWSPSNKTKDLADMEKGLSEGYGYVLSVTSHAMDWYKPTDLSKKEVEFVCKCAVTGRNHYITVYTIDTYKDVKSGKTFKGVQVIDGANLSAHGRGRFKPGECDNDYILDISTLHDAKNFNSPFYKSPYPISATAPTADSSANEDNANGDGSGSGGNYVILDDTVRKLNSKHSIINSLTCTGGNKGYVVWGAETLENFYVYPTEVTKANKGTTIIYKAEDGFYYRLTAFRSNFNPLKAGVQNTMNKVLTQQDDIMVERFMDSDCTVPVDLVENTSID